MTPALPPVRSRQDVDPRAGPNFTARHRHADPPAGSGTGRRNGHTVGITPTTQVDRRVTRSREPRLESGRRPVRSRVKSRHEDPSRTGRRARSRPRAESDARRAAAPDESHRKEHAAGSGRVTSAGSAAPSSRDPASVRLPVIRRGLHPSRVDDADFHRPLHRLARERTPSLRDRHRLALDRGPRDIQPLRDPGETSGEGGRYRSTRS